MTYLPYIRALAVWDLLYYYDNNGVEWIIASVKVKVDLTYWTTMT